MLFWFQKYILYNCNRVFSTMLIWMYDLIIIIFYNNFHTYILLLKESLLVDYLHKTYLMRIIINWYTVIGLYFENFGSNYFINKITKVFNINWTLIENTWFNYFLQTYFFFFLFNTYLVFIFFF